MRRTCAQPLATNGRTVGIAMDHGPNNPVNVLTLPTYSDNPLSRSVRSRHCGRHGCNGGEVATITLDSVMRREGIRPLAISKPVAKSHRPDLRKLLYVGA